MITDEQRATILGEPLIQAIDRYFDARGRFGIALITMDQEAMVQAARDERAALADWMTLLVNRIDGRSVSMLVESLMRLANVEQALGITHRPHLPGEAREAGQ